MEAKYFHDVRTTANAGGLLPPYVHIKSYVSLGTPRTSSPTDNRNRIINLQLHPAYIFGRSKPLPYRQSFITVGATIGRPCVHIKFDVIHGYPQCSYIRKRERLTPAESIKPDVFSGDSWISPTNFDATTTFLPQMLCSSTKYIEKHPCLCYNCYIIIYKEIYLCSIP